MKILSLLFLLISGVSFASDVIELEVSSGETISIKNYPAESDVLYIYLPSERGFSAGQIPTIQQLAFEGFNVWALDLHESYMVPKFRGSIDRFSVDDVLDVLALAQKKGFKKLFFVTSGRGAKLALNVAYQWQSKYPESKLLQGQIFHSPHLIDGRPELGNQAKYIDIAHTSNLPTYIILPQFGTKYFRAEEIAEQLKQGGSSVFLHRLSGVNGGFHMRKLQDLNPQSIAARDRLSDTYLQATQLLQTVDVPSLVKKKKQLKATSSQALSESVLQVYQGQQNIPLELTTYEGQIRGLADYKNRVVLLNFWASWCKPCIKEVPSLMRLQANYNTKDFQIITINIGESKKEIAEFIDKVGLNLPILMDRDGQSVKDWRVYVYPSNFLLDRKGKIRYAYRGALEWDSQAVIETINQLL